MVNQHRVLIALGYGLLILFLMLVVGCYVQDESLNRNSINDMTMPTSQPTPEFIMRISPSESEQIPVNVYQEEILNARGFTDSLGVYNANVCIEIRLGRLAQSGDNFTKRDTVLERIDMYVDDQELVELHSYVFWGDYLHESNDGRTSWAQPPTFCWHAPLAAGMHEAEFQFRQTSGDVQSYTWHFLLTDEK